MNRPVNWIEARLGEVCSVEIGGTPSRQRSDYWDAEHATLNTWVSIRDMNQRVIFDTAERISDAGVKHSNAKLQQKGTVLLSFKLTIGRVAVAGVPLYTNEAIAGLKPIRGLTSEYLYHGLQYWDLLQDVDQAIKGATLNKEKLKRITLSFPKLTSEQTKITEILSTVNQAIEQTEALIAKQQRIKTGLMQDLLTRGIDKDGNLRSEETHEFKDSPLGRIPVDWEVAAIEQKLERIIDYRGRTPAKVESGVPLLTAKNVRDGYINEEPREFIAESAFNSWMTRGIPKPGDVLFTTEAPMGNVALVPEYRIALAQRLITLCPKPNELSQAYLFWLLHWKRSTERLELLTSGSTVVGVKQSVFRKVEFSFPGLAEQQRISVILNSLNRAAENQSNKLTKLRSLKTALMQDLLTGDVSVTPLMAKEEIGV